jgi:type VI secretion system secreted protein Hcp
MQGKASLGGGIATGKATMRELRITKRVDKSSTALMSALRSNELIKEATLTLRKIGKTPLEYLKIKIEEGRVMAIDLDAGDASGSPALLERVTLSFNKISIEYTPQGADGMPQGTTNFEDEWTTQA